MQPNHLLGSITGQCNQTTYLAPSQVSATKPLKPTGTSGRICCLAPSQVSATKPLQPTGTSGRICCLAPSQVSATKLNQRRIFRDYSWDNCEVCAGCIESYLSCVSVALIEMFFSAGGTDIIGCFAACCSDLPVHRGEIQCRVLGMAMESWDETGNTPPFRFKRMPSLESQLEIE